MIRKFVIVMRRTSMHVLPSRRIQDTNYVNVSPAPAISRFLGLSLSVSPVFFLSLSLPESACVVLFYSEASWCCYIACTCSKAQAFVKKQVIATVTQHNVKGRNQNLGYHTRNVVLAGALSRNKLERQINFADRLKTIVSENCASEIRVRLCSF